MTIFNKAVSALKSLETKMEKISPSYLALEKEIEAQKRELFEMEHVMCPFCAGKYSWNIGDMYVGVDTQICSYCKKGWIRADSDVLTYPGYERHLREKDALFVLCEKDLAKRRKMGVPLGQKEITVHTEKTPSRIVWHDADTNHKRRKNDKA